MASRAMVELHGVVKTYARATGGRVAALEGLDLGVPAGELVVVVGGNAAGKSTLLRLVTGEERPTRGTVLVDGVEVATLRPARLARLRRRLGIVPQVPRLVPDRTALGNLTWVLRALGASRRVARVRALEALAEAGLTAARNALPGELAEGERRRLVVARALAPGPRLLVADEPAAMLDAEGVAAVAALVRGAHARGTTCLVATRSRDLAQALGGRVVQLAQGRLTPGGAPG